MAMSFVLLAAGFVFSFVWGPIVHHSSVWSQSDDLWSSFRAAQLVSWGHFGLVYSATYFSNPGIPGLVCLPGLWIVLAPLAWLSDHFGGTQSIPFPLSHPSAWPGLLGLSLALSSCAVFGVDALARKMGFSQSRRVFTGFVAVIGAFEMTAKWGHPEDAIAVGLVAYGLVAAHGGLLNRCAWLLGLAICFQPLAGLAAIVLLGFARPLGTLQYAWRVASAPIAIAIIPLVQDWKHASAAIFKQPTFPDAGWHTPWLRLVRESFVVTSIPHRREALMALANARCLGGQVLNSSRSSQCAGLKRTLAYQLSGRLMGVHIVSASTVRLGALVASSCLASWLFLSRKPPSLELLVWACSAALLIRTLFEVVMFPYYVVPGLILMATTVGAQSSRKKAVVSFSCLGVLFFYVWHHGLSGWWYSIDVCIVVLICFVCYPRFIDSSDRLKRDELVH
ncbi:MAG TPA: hypothetical protein VMU77_03235 [Acidimicrobiales bacterium]|nr:hypothetical protein [Acidimicrobiales bacterium]